jgi:integrase
MATINPRQDQDGITIGWQAIVRRKGYPSQTKTFRTKKDAEAWARGVEAEMDRGVWRDRSAAEGTTLRECLDRYMREVLPGKKDGGKREAGYVRQWSARPVSCRFMAAIRGKDVAEAIKEMEAEGKSANTIRLHLALLSHLFNVARTEWGMEALSNPVEVVRKPRLPQGRERRLIGDEEERLLASARVYGEPMPSIITIALETAMRRAEICGLRWENVDMTGRVAMLPDTKNGTFRRVPLSSVAVSVLTSLPRRLDGQVWDVKPDTVTQAFERICQRAGIDGLTFHDLRHEATSRLFEKGFNPMEVSAITGHKTLQMLKRYTHLRAEDLAKRMG